MQKSELERATEIAEAEKINQLKMAEYRREQDTAKANADQAYDLETARARQQVTEQEMQVKIIERQKQIELEEKEILRRERQYDSEVKKKPMQTVIQSSSPQQLRKPNSSRKPMPRSTVLKQWRRQRLKKSELTG